MPASLRVALFLVLGLAALSPRSAHAQEWIHIDHCDTATVNGTLVQHVSFTVTNRDPFNTMGTLDLLEYFEPAPGDTCHPLSYAAPAGWIKTPTGDNHPSWLAYNVGAPLAPGQSKSGFELTLSRPACCFTAVFAPGSGPLGDVLKILGECFECPALVTPTGQRSWGALKVLYR